MERVGATWSSGARWLVTRPVRAFEFLRRYPLLPAVVLVALVITGIVARIVAPYDPIIGNVRERAVPPMWQDEGSAKHILGTDHVGRDVLSRLLYGAQISLMVAGISVGAGFVVGSTLGVIAGWFGGIIDEIITRFVDMWMATPFLLVALVVALVLGQSLIILLTLLAILAWVGFVRVVRGHTLTFKDSDYIFLAKVAGASTWRILRVHVVPGIINTAVINATLNIGTLIMMEATLSFLGVGIPPPTPSWGGMVSDGRNYLVDAWWQSFFPGLCIFLTVLSLQFLGDWLRDYLDPRLRQLM